MPTLIMVLAGPMQSWGEQATFAQRHTLSHPTRSGVLGILGCAHGTRRGDDAGLARLRECTVAVRIDRPGDLITDYHTIGTPDAPVVNAAGRARTTSKGAVAPTLPTTRQYLSDAVFVVAVTHPEATEVSLHLEALQRPHWPLFLGRKSCPPALPIGVAVTDADDGVDALTRLPVFTVGDAGPLVQALIVHDAANPEQASSYLNDDPVSWGWRTRAHAGRAIAVTSAAFTPEMHIPIGPQGWVALRDVAHGLPRREDTR